MDMEKMEERLSIVESKVKRLEEADENKDRRLVDIERRLSGIDETIKETTRQTNAEIKSVETELKSDIKQNQTVIIESNERTTERVLKLVSDTNLSRTELWKYILGAGGLATLIGTILQALFT